MAIPYSSSAGPGRRLLRRQQTIEEALDTAVAIMEEAGVGGLSMSEIARRLGMRQPSLYKYFPSLHAVYDALFARGAERSGAAVQAAVQAGPRGVVTIRAAGRARVRWAVSPEALTDSAENSLIDYFPSLIAASTPLIWSRRNVEAILKRSAFSASRRLSRSILTLLPSFLTGSP